MYFVFTSKDKKAAYRCQVGGKKSRSTAPAGNAHTQKRHEFVAKHSRGDVGGGTAGQLDETGAHRNDKILLGISDHPAVAQVVERINRNAQGG